MKTASVTEITRDEYLEARQARHLAQVRRVRESLLHRPDDEGRKPEPPAARARR
jgi:hypothetical protein